MAETRITGSYGSTLMARDEMVNEPTILEVVNQNTIAESFVQESSTCLCWYIFDTVKIINTLSIIIA